MQLTIVINCISSKDVEEEHVMHSKSDSIEFVHYDNANEVVDELFESLLSKYKIALKNQWGGRGGWFYIQFSLTVVLQMSNEEF